MLRCSGGSGGDGDFLVGGTTSNFELFQKYNVDNRNNERITLYENYFSKYRTVFLLDLSYASSFISQTIRKKLRRSHPDTVLVFSKWRLTLAAVERVVPFRPSLAKLIPHIKSNQGLIFTNDDSLTVSSIINSECKWVEAREGVTCPVDVYLQRGPTGLAPCETSFLPALNIATKICQGCIYFLNDICLVKKGETVGLSQASLLRLLRMAPIPRKIEIVLIFEDGYLTNPDSLLQIEKRVLSNFSRTVFDIECIGKEIGYPTTANFTRTVMVGYTNLLSIAVETNYSFHHAEKFIGNVLLDQLARNGVLPKNTRMNE